MAFDEEEKREDGVHAAVGDADEAAIAASSPYEGASESIVVEAAVEGASQEAAAAAGPSPAPARKKKGVLPLVVLLVVFLSGAIGGAGYLLWQKLGADHITSQEVSAANSGDSVQEEAPKVKNPIDFEALQKENPEIYAWVSIPGTKVDTAVLQSATDDNHYLNHNERRESSVEGAAYTQCANAKDFGDPVTLIYGHQVAGDGMFTTLHYFEDPDFFQEHDTMYIYTDDRVLTYRIIAAYQYDDRHILNSYDFSKPEVLQEYYATVTDPASMLVNVREGASLSVDDKIVQLSTCMDAINRDNTRYLVTGVLTSEQETY